MAIGNQSLSKALFLNFQPFESLMLAQIGSWSAVCRIIDEMPVVLVLSEIGFPAWAIKVTL